MELQNTAAEATVVDEPQVATVPTHRGTCFCGAIEIEARGEPLEMGYCHCGSCRAYSGTPVTSFTLWKQEDVRVLEGEQYLGRFQKTAMSDRRFCLRCGGHVMVLHPGLGLADVHSPVLPTVRFAPTVHLNYAETALPMRDGLLKLKDFPAEVGGSGEAVSE
ncbi:MAG TPA: GFA family protein [Burkholderiaceae bacterium]|jgi:hypothetical protein|nr:GFA family protein [Burkholderiaceae bacterium]